MTLTSVRLAGSLQALIDTRLDTIERMLVGRVPRPDRLAIVKDVETQIFDILAEVSRDEPTREDVLAALARLDPPEAYLPEDGETGEERPVMVRRPSPVRTLGPQSERAIDPRIGKSSGILGIAALILSLLSPLSYLLWLVTESDLVLLGLLYGAFGLIFLCSLIGLVLAIVSRFRGAWSILGGVLSPVSLLYSIVASIYLTLLVMG